MSLAIAESDLRKIRNRDTLIGFLRDRLNWPAPPDLPAAEMFYDYSADELRLDKRTAEGVRVQQLANFHSDQPWGIFLLETATPKLYSTQLRRVLRGLAPSARSQRSNLPAWPARNLLFIATHNYQQFTFAHFEGNAAGGERASAARLSMFGWEQYAAGLRTLCEHNLPVLAWPDDERAAQNWLDTWSHAFDVEAVTDQFFKEFRDLFEDAKAALPKAIRKPADRHAFTQRLLNRLLFLCFLQKKRWLRHASTPHPRATYLFDLFDFAQAEGQEFYSRFLHDLFFNALNRPPSTGDDRDRDRLWRKLGMVPFLNGGLFDATDHWDEPGAVSLPNKFFEPILGELGLLRRYNFTVTESTPLNQEVAVDPEMLGKVFETVVLTSEGAEDYQAPNLRKATGSYYTPRIVVTFIVREVLKDYLTARISGLSKDRLGRLMEMDAAGGFTDDARARLREAVSQAEAESIRGHLNTFRACDPAIGSGAFALGLLHEIVNLHILCETVERGKDPRLSKPNLVFDLKKRVIENTVYGVDLQAKAVEICKLRLWLSLIVDYQVDVDLEACIEYQFERAIREIPALPNLAYKIRRGDALLDLTHGRPFRMKEITHNPAMQDEREALEKAHHEFFNAQDPRAKRRLRLDALSHRTRLTRLQLESQRAELAMQATQLDFLEKKQSKAQGRAREAAIVEIDSVLAEVAKTEEALKPLLNRQSLSAEDDEALTQLEATSEGEDITFIWELDFPEIFATPQEAAGTVRDAMRGIVNQTKGQMELPVRETARGGFDAIVGNPPFVTARNPEKRELYRERWKETSHLKFQLVAPFFQRSFGLLRPEGRLGFIVSNAFAKREFGKPLVEKFFPTVELQKVVDCSGLMFPGHGTPTCIVFGRAPLSRRAGEGPGVRVVATLPGGGDLRTMPERSPLWAALQAHHDQPGYSDERIMVADRSREDMAKWPWNLDVSTEPTRKQIGNHLRKLEDLIEGDIGVCTMTNADDIFLLTDDSTRRIGLPSELAPTYHQGEELRDWSFDEVERLLVPYDSQAHIISESKLAKSATSYLKPFRDALENRHSFGSKTFKELGRIWYEFERMNAKKYSTPQFLAFPMIATHQHFTYLVAPRVFGRHAQVVKLPATSIAEDHHCLAGVLNSSGVLFWLKEVCFSKRESEEAESDTYYEFAGGKVQQLPIPSSTLESGALRERLTALSRACWERGQVLPRFAYKKLFEKEGEAYYEWNSSLAGWVKPSPLPPLPDGERGTWRTRDELRGARERYRAERERLRREMIALQEEMDWLVYAAYGLLTMDHPAVGGATKVATTNLATRGNDRSDDFSRLNLGERPFELLRDGRPIPDHFSPERRALWQARLQTIAENEHIRRIEQPVYKRRWYRKVSDEAEFWNAFEWWLLEKAEWWLEKKARGGPIALEEWAAALWEDERVRTAVEVVEPEAVSPAGFAKLFKRTVNESTVPAWIPLAMPWEQVEKKFKATVPGRAKKIRGKLNVPRERFRLTETGQYAWAGLGK